MTLSSEYNTILEKKEHFQMKTTIQPHNNIPTHCSSTLLVPSARPHRTAAQLIDPILSTRAAHA